MFEPQLPEEFDLHHGRAMKHLELAKASRDLAKREAEPPKPQETDLLNTFDPPPAKFVTTQGAWPEMAFKTALAALTDIDTRRFIIENLVEQ